ncbi:MAG: DUF4299 domain-containing protein [Erysipelotrichaceae bacterium]|nr:DUF4299 domain-containing protein [Erysipelotrichaceae bacterium]
MITNIIIKHNNLLNSNNIQEIAELKDLSYGTLDLFNCINYFETNDKTILFDKNNIGRGIELFINNDNIEFSLNLPSSIYEIKLLYSLIKNILIKLNANEFYKDNKLSNISNIEKYIDEDINNSINALQMINEKVEKNRFYTLVNAVNPIDLSIKEMKEINYDLKSFGKLINNLQSVDAIYTTPQLLNLNDLDTTIAIYVLIENTNSIIPNKVFNLSVDKKTIKNFYVLLSGIHFIRFEEFINNVELKYYDYNHSIIKLSRSKIDCLINNLEIDISAN